MNLFYSFLIIGIIAGLTCAGRLGLGSKSEPTSYLILPGTAKAIYSAAAPESHAHATPSAPMKAFSVPPIPSNDPAGPTAPAVPSQFFSAPAIPAPSHHLETAKSTAPADLPVKAYSPILAHDPAKLTAPPAYSVPAISTSSHHLESPKYADYKVPSAPAVPLTPSTNHTAPALLDSVSVWAPLNPENSQKMAPLKNDPEIKNPHPIPYSAPTSTPGVNDDSSLIHTVPAAPAKTHLPPVYINPAPARISADLGTPTISDLHKKNPPTNDDPAKTISFPEVPSQTFSAPPAPINPSPTPYVVPAQKLTVPAPVPVQDHINDIPVAPVKKLTAPYPPNDAVHPISPPKEVPEKIVPDRKYLIPSPLFPANAIAPLKIGLISQTLTQPHLVLFPEFQRSEITPKETVPQVDGY